MEGPVKGKGFKMKGHSLPGINQRSEGNTDLPDGRSASSALQLKEGTMEQKSKAVKHGEKYGDDPGYQSYLDKTMGGETTVKGGKSYTKKDSPAKQDYVANIYDPKWSPGGTVDFEGRPVKKGLQSKMPKGWKTKAVPRAKTKMLKQVAKKATTKGLGKLATGVVKKGAGRLAGGPAGVLAGMAYGAYKSGQKHSGGKAVKGQKSFMEESKKKTKSIFKK